MTTILLSNIWEVIELLFQENYIKLQSSPDFKIMSTLNKKNKLKQVSLAIPYWSLFACKDYIDYITCMHVSNKPYYDEDIESFVFSSAKDMLTQMHNIMNHLQKIFVEDEDLKYKTFVIDIILKKHTATQTPPEEDIAFMMNNLRF